MSTGKARVAALRYITKALTYARMSSICGLQEVMYQQLQDIDKLIGSQYDHVSAGREDGDRQGEVCSLTGCDVSRTGSADLTALQRCIHHRHVLSFGISGLTQPRTMAVWR